MGSCAPHTQNKLEKLQQVKGADDRHYNLLATHKKTEKSLNALVPKSDLFFQRNTYPSPPQKIKNYFFSYFECQKCMKEFCHL